MNWLGLQKRQSRHRHTAQMWDREYREGRWERLGDLNELAHFSVLAGYFRSLAPAGGSLLDVGCGEGLLLPHVACHAGRYLGIDVEAAVNLAIERRQVLSPGAEFRVADMNEFVPPERFDAIAFCESIYYLDYRVARLQRYLQALKPQGVLLVSCHLRSKHNVIWSDLESICESIDSVQVVNGSVAWNVRAMRPKGRAA
jgi:SAM-dependent methyltransferase